MEWKGTGSEVAPLFQQQILVDRVTLFCETFNSFHYFLVYEKEGVCNAREEIRGGAA
jgi:hypothetical protein